MLKSHFLKTAGFMALLTPFVAGTATVARASDETDALIGLWEAVVHGDSGIYRYIYSISRGAYVATANIDERYMGFKYSPTMGAYAANGDRSYAYHERGYVFDLSGKPAGTFTTIGSIKLDLKGNTFDGPGTFTQYDLNDKAIATEKLTVSAKRLRA